MDNIITIGVDLGNYAVKTSEYITFRSVSEKFEYKHQMKGENSILFKGIRYVVGEGEVDNSSIKTHRKDTIPLLLNALYKSIKRPQANIRLITGLPLEHHKDTSLISETKSLYTGTFDFKYITKDEATDISYNIKEVYVFPECMASFYSINQDMLNRDVLVIDIGGGTVNIALFVDGEYEDSITIPFGMNTMYSKIVTKANHLNTGATFTVEDILKFINRGYLKWDSRIDNMEYAESILSEFAYEIVNQLKGKFPIYKSYEIMLSGGGSNVMENYLSPLIDFSMINETIFANALGFYNVGVGING